MVRPFGSLVRTWKALAAAVAMALVAVVLIATPGSATFAKKYDLVMSSTPSPVPVGTSATVKATFTNKSLYSIGSVTLARPSAKYTITAASASAGPVPTVTGGGSGVSVTGLNLILNKPYTITMTVSVACDAVTGSWGSTAKLLGGSTLFTLNNPGNSQKTTVSGTCAAPPGPITIDIQDPVGPTPPTTVKFIPGVSDVTFYASPPSGNPLPTITWQFSTDIGFSSPTNVGTGSSFSLTPATGAAAGYYRARADNGVGTPSTSSPILLEPSTLTLEFVTEPTDAVKGAVITGTPLDPSGAPVQVQLKADGNPSGALDGQTVTITNSGAGTGGFGGTNTATLAGGGLASFPGLSIDTAGEYTLSASVDGGGPSTDDVAITINDAVVECGTTTAPVDGVTIELLAGDGCEPVPYILERNGNEIQFLKDPSIQQEFIIRVNSWDAENAVNPLPPTQIDTPGGLHPIKWCTGTAQDPSVLPGSEVTCLVNQSAELQGDGKVKVSEVYYLFGDILYKR